MINFFLVFCLLVLDYIEQLKPDTLQTLDMMSSISGIKTLTKDLVYDFIINKLRKAGPEEKLSSIINRYNNNSKQINSELSCMVHKTLRCIGEEFHNLYFASFEEMTGAINVHGDDIKQVFCGILDVTCETGIEWGRIVGIFVFAALLSVKAMDCDRADVVENIISWTTEYLQGNNYTNWIHQHGGWVSGLAVIHISVFCVAVGSTDCYYICNHSYLRQHQNKTS